jgi:hypothetical protein
MKAKLIVGSIVVVLAAAMGLYLLDPFGGTPAPPIDEGAEDSSEQDLSPTPSARTRGVSVLLEEEKAAPEFAVYFGDANGAERLEGKGGLLRIPRDLSTAAQSTPWIAARANHTWSLAVPAPLADDTEALTLRALTPATDLTLRFRIEGADEVLEPWVQIEARGEGGLAQAARLYLANLTDGSGRKHGNGAVFIVQDLPPGSYHLQCGHDGSPSISMDVRLEPGIPFDIPVVLEAGASLEGVLQSADGSPIARAAIGLLPAENDSKQDGWLDPLQDFHLYGRFPSGTLGGPTIRSDEDGRFRLESIPSGNWHLLVRSSGLLPMSQLLANPLAPGETRDLEVLQLQAGLQAQVQVQDEEGQAVPGAKVHWRRQPTEGVLLSTTRSQAYTTNAEGVAELLAMQPGSWLLEVQHPSYAVAATTFQLKPAQESPPSIAVTLSPAREFLGICLDQEQEPIVGAYIKIMPVRGSQHDAVSGIGAYTNQARSDEEGNFAFHALPPGEYFLLATHEDFAPATTDAFQVDGTRVTPFSLRMHVGASLEVLLLDEEGQPAAEEWVLVQGEIDESFFRAQSNEQGFAQFTHLPKGTYRAMRAAAVPIATSRHGRLHRDYEFVALLDGESRELILGGRERLTRLEGYVVSGGRAQAGKRVALLADDGVRSAVSDAAGFFEIANLVPGSYLFQVSDPVSGNSSAGSFFGTVEVRDIDINKRDIVLPQAAVEVHVVDHASGRPIEHLPVSLRPADGTELAVGAFDSTDAQGIALFPTLRPGSYLICAGDATQPYFGGDGRRDAAMHHVVVKEGAEGTIRAELRLKQGATFHGRVFDREGNAVEGAYLHYLDRDGNLLNRLSLQSTNAQGHASLKGLPAGVGYVLARHPQLGQVQVAVDLLAGRESQREMVLERGFFVEVTAVDDTGHPLTGVLVSVLDEKGQALPQPMSGQEAQAVRLAMLRGTPQRLGPLPAGKYSVQLYRPGEVPSEHSVELNAASSGRDLRLPY